jgi:Domain of unknown function (DUF4384)
MKTSRIVRRRWLMSLGAVTLFAGSHLLATASAQGDGTRWKLSGSAARYEHNSSDNGRHPTPRPAAARYEEVGITLWKMRPAKTDDPKEVRAFDYPDSDPSGPPVQLTPQRVNADTPFALGDKVRLSIETARRGFLYVINREIYSDNTFGEAKLIFPITRLREGNNQIRPRIPVELPDWNDHPVYFRLKSSNPKYAGEELIVLVTSQELADVKGRIGRRALPITNEQLARWEMRASTSVDKLELKGGAGKAYTRREKEAGADLSRELTYDDELPQTLYQVPVKGSAPLLLKIALKIDK